MLDAKPGDSRHNDIVNRRQDVFGPSIDALVRTIDARIDASRRGAFHALIESWPVEDDGAVRDPDALFHRLEELRASVAAALPGEASRVVARRQGSAGAAVAGLVIGGVVGLPFGFLVYLVARETVLPSSLWSSDALMWGVIGAVMALLGLAGAMQGARPTRLGQALKTGLLGLLVGALLGGLSGGLLALTIGEILGVSQMEGAFAMGVVFGVMPVAGLLGGLALAFWMGRKAWRAWHG